MLPRRIGLGVLGAGAWARAAHLPSLAHDGGARLVSVANRTLTSAETVAAAHGFEHADPDPQSLLARPEIEAVLITAPVPDHHRLTLAAIAAGKHVLVESSLCMTSAEARELLEAADRAGVKHATTRPRPYLYGGARVAELLAEGALGIVHSALFTWRGNPWLHANPEHNWRIRADRVPPLLFGMPAAILVALFGPATRVSARATRFVTPSGDYPLGPDYASALIEHASGVHVTLQSGANAGPPAASGITIFGADATLTWDWNRPGSVVVARPNADGPEDAGGNAPGDLAADFPYARDLLAAIREDRRPLVTFADAETELRLVEACLTSMDTSTEVRP